MPLPVVGLNQLVILFMAVVLGHAAFTGKDVVVIVFMVLPVIPLLIALWAHKTKLQKQQKFASVVNAVAAIAEVAPVMFFGIGAVPVALMALPAGLNAYYLHLASNQALRV